MTEKINELAINCKLKGMREEQKRGREKGRNNENKEGYFPWKGRGVLTGRCRPLTLLYTILAEKVPLLHTFY